MAASREKLVRNAEKFVSRGRIEAAIREYRKVLADQPRDTGTLNRVGDLYARINRIDEAVRLFTQIAEQYTEEGFLVKAIAIYKKIIKLDPTRLSVYEKLAELYHRQGLVNEARTQYQVLADYYAKHENSTSAISIYQQMAALEPEDPAHRVKLAELYQQGKLNDKAMEQYQLIADVMLGHGRVNQAVQVLQRGLEIDPQDLDYLAQAVDKLRGAEENEAARKLLETAKEQNPAAESLMEAAEPEEAAPPDEPMAEAPLETDSIQVTGEPSAEPGDEVELLEIPPEDSLPATETLLGMDSSLEEALAEAEAAVVAEPAEEGLGEGDDFLIGWDEEEADSLIKPPPDMAEVGPEVTGSGFRDAVDLESEDVDLTASWELDLDALETVSETPTEAEPADGEKEPEPATSPKDLESVPADDLFETIDTEPGSSAAAPAAEAVEEIEDLELELDFDLDPGLGEGLDEPPAAAEGEELAVSTPEDLLSEAEVLAKYGLKEKAFLRVQEVLDEDPEHLGATRVLIQLHLEQGDDGKVRELAGKLRERSRQRGESADWEQVQDLFTVAGFELDTSRKKQPPKPPAKPTKRKRTTDRIDRLLASLLEGDPLASRGGLSRRREKALDELFVEPKSSPSKPSPQPAPEPVEVEPPEIPAELASPPDTEAPAAPEIAPDVAPAAETPAADATSPPSPANLDLEDHSDIEDALAGMEPSAIPPPAEAIEEDPLDESGTSWLDEVEADRRVDSDTAEVFEEEESFFVDLAAELEEELTVSDALGPQQSGEQSLEEIVEGFKRGVEEQLSEEDYDTHFDLGIAYREMGLLDEAIGEFQVAAKAPEHVAACCSMLGICFLEKGLPELAIKWYTRGLASPEVSDEDSLALLYDLGSAYLALGDRDNARKTFVEVYGINSHYRDVPAKLDELGEA